MTETSLTAEDCAWVVIDGHRTEAHEIDGEDVVFTEPFYRSSPEAVVEDSFWFGHCHRTVVMVQRPTEAEARLLTRTLISAGALLDDITGVMPEMVALRGWDTIVDSRSLYGAAGTRDRDDAERFVANALIAVLWRSVQRACSRLDWDNAWHVTIRDGEVVGCVKVGEGGSDG